MPTRWRRQVDRLSSDQRSRLMSCVRGKNTRAEIAVRRLIYGLGFRYRLYDRELPGTPDIVFRRRRKAIFVNGCFWHQHPRCSKANPPKSRRSYWIPKLTANKQRDKRKILEMRRLGWSVLVVWECDLKRTARLTERLSTFLLGEAGCAEQIHVRVRAVSE
jgi:DNA mismatch endonuclease (patch repair protein)